MAEKRVSLSGFVEAGLVNDTDVVFDECRFARFDYDGKADSDTTVLKIIMHRADDSEDTDPIEQVWSVGGDDNFWPSEDGTYLVSRGSRGSLAKRSNFHYLMESLEKCGLEPDKYGEDISVLDGTRCHVNRVPIMRVGLEPRKDRDGKDRPQEVLLVKEVRSWPWDKKGRKGAGKTKTTAKGSSASKKTDSESDTDDEDIATKAVMKVLAGAANPLQFYELLPAVTREVPRSERAGAATFYGDEDWVAGLPGVEVASGKYSIG